MGLASHPGLRPFVEREEEDDGSGSIPIRRERNPVPKLAVDAGGVGAAVTDLLLTPKVLEHLDVTPIMITGGERWSEGTWGDTGRKSYNVSKLDLVSMLVARMQAKHLKFRPGDPLSATLEAELRSFDLKLTKAGNATFEARTEGDHDDLVIAVGLALWLAERPKNIGWWGPNPFQPSASGAATSPAGAPGRAAGAVHPLRRPALGFIGARSAAASGENGPAAVASLPLSGPPPAVHGRRGMTPARVI